MKSNSFQLPELSTKNRLSLPDTVYNGIMLFRPFFGPHTLSALCFCPAAAEKSTDKGSGDLPAVEIGQLADHNSSDASANKAK